MPVDPQQLLAMMKRTRDAFPALQERAIQSGDFSELDKASTAMDRLSSLADQHIATQQQAAPQSAPGGPQLPAAGLEATGATPDPASKALDDVIASQHIQKQQDTAGGTSPVQEATKGAVKGVLEAAKAPIQMPPAVFPTGPHHQGPPAMPPPAAQGAMPDPETDQVINQAYRIDKGGYDAELETALAQARKLDKNGYDAELETALDQAKKIDSGAPSLPPGDGSLPPDAQNLPAQDDAPSLPGSESDQAPDGGEARDFGAMPPSPKDVAKVAGKEFGNDPKRLVQGLAPYAKDAPQWEREYLQRVALELGDRPKQGIFEKLAIALTLGAGSIMGAWLSHRYSGQALLDMNDDQKDYDKSKREIGKETYLANKGLDKAALPLPDRKEIEQAKEQGRNSRASGTNDTRLAVSGNAEAGKNERAAQHEDRLDARQAKMIQGRIDMLSSKEKQATAKMNPGDRLAYDKAKTQYMELSKDHSNFLIDDKTYLKQQGPLLDQMQAIIDKYQSPKK